jgi:hypothetical protein
MLTILGTWLLCVAGEASATTSPSPRPLPPLGSAFEAEQISPYASSWKGGVRITFSGRSAPVPEVDAVPVPSLRARLSTAMRAVSAQGGTTPCSILHENDQPGCSTTAGQQQCSVFGGKNDHCSTRVHRPIVVVQGCSALSGGAASPPQQCSVFGNSTGNECSVFNNTTHANCSAGATSDPASTCSVYGGSGSSGNRCSTIAGQFTQCSVGQDGSTTTSHQCSVTGVGDAGSAANECSVFGNSGSGPKENRCSIFSSAKASTPKCSVFGTTGTSSSSAPNCSAMARPNGNESSKNAECSTHVFGGESSDEQCSVIGDTADTRGTCSAFEDTFHSACSIFTASESGLHFCSVESNSAATCTAMGTKRTGVCSVINTHGQGHCSVRAARTGGGFDYTPPAGGQCKGANAP